MHVTIKLKDLTSNNSKNNFYELLFTICYNLMQKAGFQNSVTLKIFTEFMATLNRAKSNKISQIDSPWEITFHVHVRLRLSHSKVHK